MLAILIALAAGSMTARTLGAAARRDPVKMLRDSTRPGVVISGLLRGSPAQPGWQEAAAPFAGREEFRALLLLTLSREGELKPQARSWLAVLAAGTKSGSTSREASLDRLLAAFALERPGDARQR